MIFRLEFCNKQEITARVDITTPGSSTVQAIEGTERPFILKYKNDKNDKSGRFRTSSAEINIYETSLFNIDTLKTSSETDIKVDYYVAGVKRWTGFVIPDFFSRQIGSNSTIQMIASDRIGTLKGITLEKLPATLTVRDIIDRCLQKTGLDLPLKTIADFNWDSSGNGFFRSKIWSQRLFDTKSRSISCYDILGSILTASHSKIQQYNAEWYIVNKYQHETGVGRLYGSETEFINWMPDIVNFSEITKGANQSIIPVAASVGVYQEHGGGRLHPDNYDFSLGLNGWTPVGGFNALVKNEYFDKYLVSGGGIYTPKYDPDKETEPYLVNDNPYIINEDPVYLESEAINIPYSGAGSIQVEIDINGAAPKVYPNVPEECSLTIAVVAVSNDEELILDHGGKFVPMPSINPPVFRKTIERGPILPGLEANMDTKSMKVTGTLEVNNLNYYRIHIRIYGSGEGRTVTFSFASVKMRNSEERPKGIIYKTEQGANYTKSHDIETSIIGDYLTGGLNGYFYDYPVDDTSVIYNASFERTGRWTAPNQVEDLPLLEHVTRQMAHIFSVAHDLITGEIDIADFNPLSIFQDCNNIRYTVVSADFNFLKSTVNVQLEEIAYEDTSRLDYIYSYFGEGEQGVRSLGGIASGTGGGGSGLTTEQVTILSNLSEWWKIDDNGNLFTPLNVYSLQGVSAYGLGPGGGGGGGSLADLTDVDLSGLSVGDMLTFNGSHWVPISRPTPGSQVSWGVTADSYSPLTVDGLTKSVALQGHLHNVSDITGLTDILDGKFNTPTGSTSQYVRGDGTLATFPDATSVSWDNIVSIRSGSSFRISGMGLPLHKQELTII